jgi:hypothetical protein
MWKNVYIFAKFAKSASTFAHESPLPDGLPRVCGTGCEFDLIRLNAHIGGLYVF